MKLSMIRFINLVFCLISIFLLVGCGKGGYANSPEGVTTKLFDSIAENDANKYLDSITPEERQQPGFFFARQMVQGIFGGLGLGQVEAAKLELGFSDMTIQTTSRNADTAQVHVEGNIRDLNLGMETPFSIDVTTVKIDGTWLVQLSTNINNTSSPTADNTNITSSESVNPVDTNNQSSYIVYAQNVLTGSEAEQQVNNWRVEYWGYLTGNFSNSMMNLEEGWQYVTFYLVIEPQVNNWSPITLTGSLIDSGGYTREVSYDTMYSFQMGSPGKYDQQFWFSGIRIRFPAISVIPLNQTPITAIVCLVNPGSGSQNITTDYTIDLTQPADNLAIPFDHPPSYWPSLDNGSFIWTNSEESETPVNIQVSNIRQETVGDGNFYFVYFTVTIENIGGNNVSSIQRSPGVIAVTDSGFYADELSFLDRFEQVAPGLIKENDVSIMLTEMPDLEPNKVWLFFVDENHTPIGVMELPLHPVE